MNTGRSDSHENISHLYLGSVDKFGLFHNSGSVTCDVIFSVAIHTRHLSSLTTDESTSSLTASLCNTGNDSLDLGRNVLSYSHIVQEEERLRTLRENIIDTHGDSIDTDCVMLVHRECEFEFGSDTVGSAHENRLLDIQSRKVKHSSE